MGWAGVGQGRSSAFPPLPRHSRSQSALVCFVRAIQTTAARGAGAAPDAFRAAVSVTVSTLRAVEAAAAVRRGAAKFAAALITEMLVVLVRAV
jgi:hypothetical protein